MTPLAGCVVETRHLGAGLAAGYDAFGYLFALTNNHVVEGTTSLAVRLATGEAIAAEIVGTAPNYDLAVVRLRNSQTIPKPVAIGSSADLVGQFAFAIGNPFGLDQTLTFGVISALPRRLPTSSGHDAVLAHRYRLLTSMPGVGPVLACTLMALLPELGSMSRKQVAGLVGGAHTEKRIKDVGLGVSTQAAFVAVVVALTIAIHRGVTDSAFAMVPEADDADDASGDRSLRASKLVAATNPASGPRNSPTSSKIRDAGKRSRSFTAFSLCSGPLDRTAAKFAAHIFATPHRAYRCEKTLRRPNDRRLMVAYQTLFAGKSTVGTRRVTSSSPSGAMPAYDLGSVNERDHTLERYPPLE